MDCPPGVVRCAACQPSSTSAVTHNVKLPRRRSPASYCAQFFTRNFIFDCMTASAPSARLHWLLLNDREAREKEPSMMIIGCDFHPSFQQIACVEQETGEYEERRLNHRGEAEAFYRSLAGRAVRIGEEATGNDRWFHKLMSEVGHELLVGDASAIHASAPREQRSD